MVQLSHLYMTTEKTIALTSWTFIGKVLSLLFNMLSRLVIAFLPKSKPLNFMASLTTYSDFGASPKIVCHCFHCFPIYLPWSDGPGCHDLCWMLSFKPTFSLSSFTFIKRLFNSSLLSAIRVVSSAYLRLLMWQYIALTYSFPNLGLVCFFPCSVLTVASWPAYRFLRRQVRWPGIPISLRIRHSLLWST